MRLYKRLTALTLAAVTAVNLFGVTALAAPVYKDVPSTHWAYQYIAAVADRGLMLGDTSANFRPDELIDKFDTSKILARSAGYKYENISASEQEYYNACYEKNKSFLAQYSTKFSKWNTSADREISYLLEKEILTASDLNQFVILDDSGKEQLRALSRGESAVFITKLIGKNSEALSFTTTNLFKDDAKISASVRSYVYYLRSIGVVSGDTDGNFNPNGAVTRASMAVMLARALDLISSPTTSSGTTSSSNTEVSTISTVSGTIDTYYANLNAVQVVTSSGDKKIYRLTSTASVYIDGYLKTGSELKAGMIMSGVLNNDELISIQAQNSAGSTSTATSTATTPATGSPAVQYTTVDGTVSSIEQNGSVRTVSVEIKTVNPRDNSIIADVRTYTLDTNCKITRSDNAIQFSDIARGDIATAQVSGSTVYELALEERVLTLKDATLDEKIYNEVTGEVTLVVVDSKEKKYNLRLAAGTTISRKSVGTTTWDQLRVGDMLDLTAEYGVLRDIVAYGVLSTVDGWIESIHIANYQSYITLRDSYGVVKKYYVISESTDVYSLRVGNKMRLRLDSMEILTVMLLDEASTDVVTGYVSSVRSGQLVLTNTQPYGSNGKRTVELDSTTVFTNSKTGETVTYSAIREGQKVYVVLQNTLSNVARTVTILTE